jgi:hypothetical protein
LVAGQEVAEPSLPCGTAEQNSFRLAGFVV